MINYPHLAAALYNTPLMINQDKASVIDRVFRSHIDGTLAVDGDAIDSGTTRYGYTVTAEGIAIVPVHGTLMQRSAGLEALSGITSYQSLAHSITQAANDSSVLGLLLDIDSPGGQVAGLYGLTDLIASIGAALPVWAVANESMFSAAYAIGSAASKIYAPRTAMVGSIGVIAMHVDQSQLDQKIGVQYTAITAGAKKAELSAHQPLSADGQVTLQSMVDESYAVFVETVAANRNITIEAVVATEAGIYSSGDAVDNGLIDKVAGFDEVLTMMTEHVRESNNRGEIMSGTQPEKVETYSAAELQAARAEGQALGASAERQRISQIMTAESAQGRQAQAMVMALETDMAAESAGKVLAASPKEPDPAPAAGAGNQFADHMKSLGNFQVGVDPSEPTPEQAQQAIDASWMRAYGVKPNNLQG